MIDNIETACSVGCQRCGVANWPTTPACVNCNATLQTPAGRELFALAGGSAMSFSRKVARLFEVVDYALLLPALWGLLMSLGLISFAPWFTLIIVVSFTAGCWLLSGFIRHSRGRLSEAQVRRLWYATMAYNLIEWVAYLAVTSPRRNGELFLLGLWPLLVVLLSATALWSENQRVKFSFN